jgi:hypothetical protein
LGAVVVKNSTARFFVPKAVKTELSDQFRTVLPSETKTARGGLGVFVAKNSTASFLGPEVAKTDLSGEFRIVLPSKTETPKTQQK